MIAVLMYGATETDADLFHEIPAVIVDAFPYLEDGAGRRMAIIGPADAVHLPEFGVEVLQREDFGWDELVRSCRDEYEVGARWCCVLAHLLESAKRSSHRSSPFSSLTHSAQEG